MKGKILAAAIGIVAFVYIYPRILIQQLGPENPWTSYLYMYGFGLIFFSVGLWVIRSSGSLIPGRGRDSFWYKVLIGGYIFFASFHGLWIYFALNSPVKS